MVKEKIILREIATPCGPLVLGALGDRLCKCDWAQSKRHESNVGRLRRMLRADVIDGTSPVIEEAIARLHSYFNGGGVQLNVPLLLVGTEFQQSVWTALLSIPYSQTITYGELAGKIRRPNAVRAVANAVASNPVSIFVPCHRVIGSNGQLTGYAGGLDTKLHLLHLEKNHSG